MSLDSCAHERALPLVVSVNLLEVRLGSRWPGDSVHLGPIEGVLQGLAFLAHVRQRGSSFSDGPPLGHLLKHHAPPLSVLLRQAILAERKRYAGPLAGALRETFHSLRCTRRMRGNHTLERRLVLALQFLLSPQLPKLLNVFLSGGRRGIACTAPAIPFSIPPHGTATLTGTLTVSGWTFPFSREFSF